MKRYDDKADGGMLESEGGYWVKHADHLAEQARLQEEIGWRDGNLKAAEDTIAALLESEARLKARVEMLEGALENISKIGNHWTGKMASKALAALPASATSEGEGQ